MTQCAPTSRGPVRFGDNMPNMATTTRGLTRTTGNNNDRDTATIDITDRDNNCPMCKKFSMGPCDDVFKMWLACTDKHPGKDARGEPLHLNKCSVLADELAKCLDENTEYYTKEEEEEEDTTTIETHDDRDEKCMDRLCT